MANTNFIFRSYSKLKTNLGRFDSVVECNELAVREFVKSVNNSDKQDKYIEELSEKHGVKVNKFEPNLFHVRISQWYILSVYQQAEEFIDEFKKEHPKSHEWCTGEKQRKQKETSLQHLLRVLNLKESDIDSNGKGIRFQIFEYYRLIRNRFMHTDVDEKRLANALEKIKNYSVSVFDEFRVNAPNEYNKLTFDDFILFSRVTKDIAQEICRLAKPSPSEIVQMLLKRDKEEDPNKKEINLKSLKRFINNKEQLKKRLQHLLRSQYNLQEDEVDPIMEELIQHFPFK